MQRRFAVVALLSVGCRGAGGGGESPAGAGARVPVRAVAPPSPQHAFVLRESGFATPRRLVVRDAATWRATWAALTGGYPRGGPPLAPPPVDFAREMIAVAALGRSMPMGDHRPVIAGAARRGDTLVVTVRDSVCVSPAPNDGSDAPVALARLPAHGGPVAFAEAGEARGPCPD